jgi:hypothetical protein
MSITYEFCDGEYDLHVRFEGKITPDDVLTYFHSVFAERDSFRGISTLLEVIDITLRHFDIVAIDRLAQFMDMAQTKLDGSYTALVAENTFVYTIGRLFKSAVLSRHEFEVFRSRSEAIEWLATPALQ